MKKAQKHNISGLTKPFCIFDLETTGVSTKDDYIVSLAAVKLNVDKTTLQLEFLCKPPKPIPQGAIDVHGITNEMVADKSPFSNFAHDIKLFFADCDIGGYNSKNFDIKILTREMQESGEKDFLAKARSYDAYDTFKEDNPRKLSNAYQWYIKKNFENAHNAMADVQATISVIEKQIELRGGIGEQVIAAFNEPKVEFKHIITENGKHILNFSQKHKGKLLSEVDKGFLKWMIKQDFPEDMKTIARQYL